MMHLSDPSQILHLECFHPIFNSYIMYALIQFRVSWKENASDNLLLNLSNLKSLQTFFNLLYKAVSLSNPNLIALNPHRIMDSKVLHPLPIGFENSARKSCPEETHAERWWELLILSKDTKWQLLGLNPRPKGLWVHDLPTLLPLLVFKNSNV